MEHFFKKIRDFAISLNVCLVCTHPVNKIQSLKYGENGTSKYILQNWFHVKSEWQKIMSFWQHCNKIDPFLNWESFIAKCQILFDWLASKRTFENWT